MTTTPFLDVLTDSQRTAVKLESRGARRPSYYDPGAAAQKADAERTGITLPAEFTTDVQIGLDLEAALILMPKAHKLGLIDFINEVLAAIGPKTPSDELELMAEVVAVRADNYRTINTDLAAPLLRFETTRAAMLDHLTLVSHQNDAGEDPAAVLLPDLTKLLSALAEDYTLMATTDILAVHDRIADAATLAAYSDAGLERFRQLTSWLTVVKAYV